MQNPATVSDVEARWRPLSDQEQLVGATRLEDGWRDLRRLIPDLVTRADGNDDLTADIVQVLSDAVISVLQAGRNDGMRKGAFGVDDASASWELDASRRMELYFSPGDLAKLTGGTRPVRRAFSVMPS